MSMRNMILGITGDAGSGKDTVAEILQERGFVHLSFSDLLREELRNKNKPITRESLTVIGNELRAARGADILARLALERIEKEKSYVFTSIRNPTEVQKLQEQPDFVLIKVTASEEIRLARLRLRNREQDAQTIQELRQEEQRERSADPAAQQLHKVAEMATITIVNDATVEELRKKVDLFLHRPRMM